MDLEIEEVASLLNVSENRIKRWLEAGHIPSYKINEQYRFNRQEVEDWMLKQHGLPEDDAAAKPTGIHKFSFYRALHKGDLYQDIDGTTPEAIISETTQRMAQRYKLDAEVLTELLMDRERLMPTALNGGIAVPHTRDFLLPAHYDVITVVFPKKTLEYGALDGEPVHTLFFMFACDDRRHLDLLSKVAHFGNEERNLRLLQEKPERKTLLAHVRAWEAGLKR